MTARDKFNIYIHTNRQVELETSMLNTHSPAWILLNPHIISAMLVLKPKPRFWGKPNQKLGSDRGPSRFSGSSRLTVDVANTGGI